MPGLDTLPVLTSTTIMELDSVPAHLLVLGGGYVGLEFAQMFRRFGSAVTVVQRGAQLLKEEDADVAEAVAGILREDGVEILLQSTAVRAVPAPDRGIALTVRTPDGERTLQGSHLLAAAGRTPNTDALDPAAAGIRDGRARLHPGERSPGDERAGHLCAGRRERRSGLHPHLLRRLSHHPREPARGRRPHDGSAGALRGLHRPATGPHRAV